MRAVAFSRFGGVDAIEVIEMPDIAPAPGQVLVAVEAASINPVDVKLCSGEGGAPPAGATAPHILGWDLAGRITAVGDGVDGALLGSRVLGFANWYRSGRGLQASLAALDADNFAVAPEWIPAEQLTTLGMNALTALQAVRVSGARPGSTVVVSGASGAVGGYATLFAARLGATVHGMSAEADADAVCALGAERWLPRDAAGAMAAIGGSADIVIDAATLGAAILPVLHDGGRYVTVGSPIDTVRGIECTCIGVRASAEQLATIVQLAAEGVLPMNVDRVFPVQDAADAYRYFAEHRPHGRVVLRFSSTG